jgi:dihydropteroate synthase
MGVINFTPNSFSDGNKLLNPSALNDQLKFFKDNQVTVLDVGAESSAPSNSAISFDLEKQRLSSFLKMAQLKPEDFPTISLDSYKSEVALWFFKELSNIGFKSSQFIWNDISGVLDQSVLTFFDLFEQGRYVLCHNKAQNRELSTEHMNFVDENRPIFDEVRGFFEERPKGFSSKQSGAIILDPCFGFSKSFEQNLVLIDRFGELASLFPEQSWVFGVSKKSFLRKLWQGHVENILDKDSLLLKSEFIHQEILRRVMLECHQRSILFRVHDPLIYKSSLFLTSHKLTKN